MSTDSMSGHDVRRLSAYSPPATSPDVNQLHLIAHTLQSSVENLAMSIRDLTTLLQNVCQKSKDGPAT